MRRLAIALAAILLTGLAVAGPAAGASASSWRATIVGEHLRGGATVLLTSEGRGSVNVTIHGVSVAQPVAISLSLGRCTPDGGSMFSFLTAPASLNGTATGKGAFTRAQVAALNEAISSRRPLSILAFAPGDTGCGDLTGAPRVGTARLTGHRTDVDDYDVRYPVVSGIDPAIAGLVNAVLRNHAEATVAGFLDITGETPDPDIEGESSIDETFSVSLSQPSLLSLVTHEVPEFIGQPHGDESFLGFTFDLTTGRQIELADLFRPGSDYVAAIEQAAINALSAAGVRRELASLIVDAGNLDGWRLAPSGIRITFFGGQCCSVPITAVTIPFRALRTVLDPDSPISELLPR
jgi:hypothetical protein